MNVELNRVVTFVSNENKQNIWKSYISLFSEFYTIYNGSNHN